MSMIPLQDLLVSGEARILDALGKLDKTGKGVLLMVGPDGALRRTVTDGDLRRLLLCGFTLDTPLATLPEQRPKVLSGQADASHALAEMNLHRIDHLPVVDEAGHPVDLYLRRDLDTEILLSSPHLSDSERAFVDEAFKSNWIAPLGPNVDAFERELAAHVGVRHAAAVSSGTAAIHLALRLLAVGPGDVVFCSSLTFVASANPILYQAATPVFIDADPATWNMSPNALQRALVAAAKSNRLPKAVIVVNLYGQSADMDALNALCVEYGVPIIEDAAESLGATYKGRHSGTSGKIGVFSFNGNKIITTSGGGMIVSNDEALIRRARFLSTQARDPAGHYEHTEVGYNYRMSNVLAGIGRGQLQVLEQRVRARRNVFSTYTTELGDLSDIEWMPHAAYGRSTHWLTACTLKHPRRPELLIAALAAEKIEARRVWKPMHLQPLFSGCAFYGHDGGDIGGDLFARGICLPSGSNITPGQQDRVIRAVRSALRSSGAGID